MAFKRYEWAHEYSKVTVLLNDPRRGLGEVTFIGDEGDPHDLSRFRDCPDGPLGCIRRYNHYYSTWSGPLLYG